jgi:hypothetical protein
LRKEAEWCAIWGVGCGVWSDGEVERWRGGEMEREGIGFEACSVADERRMGGAPHSEAPGAGGPHEVGGREAG